MFLKLAFFWFVWLVGPCLLCACSGFWLVWAFTTGQQRGQRRLSLRLVLRLIGGLIVFLATGLIIFLTRSFDPRLPFIGWTFALALGIGGWGARRLVTIAQARWTKAISVMTPLLWVLCAGSLLFPGIFTMRSNEYRVLNSPDGKYQAMLIYTDGLTYGYYFVAIKSASPWHALGAAHEVAEAAAEGFDDIRWKDSHTLEVDFDKEACFARQERQWHTVSIHYHGVDNTAAKPCD